jgi:hypothetical protein
MAEPRLLAWEIEVALDIEATLFISVVKANQRWVTSWARGIRNARCRKGMAGWLGRLMHDALMRLLFFSTAKFSKCTECPTTMWGLSEHPTVRSSCRTFRMSMCRMTSEIRNSISGRRITMTLKDCLADSASTGTPIWGRKRGTYCPVKREAAER